MNTMQLSLVNKPACYRPGDVVQCEVDWQLDQSPRLIELRLLWYTRGKGSADMQVVAADQCPNLQVSGRWQIGIRIPDDAVCSYTGQLMSINWAVEVVAEKKLAFARQEIDISPTGAAVVAPATV